MLKPADQQLVERDTMLPGMRCLLDVEAVRALVDRLFPGRRIAIDGAVYLRYKPGTSILVGFAATRDEQPSFVYGKSFPLKESGKLLKRVGSDGRTSSGLPLVAVDEHLGISLHCFPADPTIPGLQDLAGDRDDRSDPGIWLGTGEVMDSATSWSLVRYKPERRAIVSLSRGGQTWAAARLYSQAAYARAKRSTKSLSARSYLGGPRRIGQSDRHAVLMMEWLPGAPLSRCMSPKALAQTAAVLARLHAEVVHGLPLFRPGALEVSLRESVQGMQHVLPELAAVLERALQSTCVGLPNAFSNVATLHGDFDPHQVLWDGTVARFLDFDEAGLGPPALDLGNFWARVLVDRLLQDDASGGDTEPREWTDFADAYRSQVPREHAASWNDVRKLAACSLLRMCVLPFRLRYDAWPRLTARIAEYAEQLACSPDGPSASRQHACLQNAAADSTSPEPTATQLPPRPTVTNTESVLADPTLGMAHPATDPAEIAARLLPLLRESEARWQQAEWNLGLGEMPRPGCESAAFWRQAQLLEVNVRRHKPGRRCLVAYTWGSPGDDGELPRTILGKSRARKLDRASLELQQWLFESGGFNGNDHRGSVPRTLGAIPEWRMWFQTDQPGISAEVVLSPENDPVEATWIAEALRHVHTLNSFAARRTHDRHSELTHLEQRYSELASRQPQLRRRLDDLLSGLRERCGQVPESRLVLIHRDFHPAQVILRNEEVCLVDWDLAAIGEPELDVGNFVAHLREIGLRSHGDPEALGAHELAFVTRYCDLAGDESRAAIELYCTLALARLVYLSSVLAKRQHTTLLLLDLCEQQLYERLRTYQ